MRREALLDHAVGEALTYVQGESLKVSAALLTEAFKLPDHQVWERKMKSLCGVGLLIFSCQYAHAACQIKSETAIYCDSGRLAVVTFRTYGYNAALMRQSNNVELIHRIGCGFVARGAKVEQTGHGRVPLIDGWAGVTTVVLNDSSNGFMADEYLVGQCTRYKVGTYVFPGLESPPEGQK